MKNIITTVIILFLFISSAFSETLRIDIKGQLKGSSNLVIFHGQLLLTVGQSHQDSIPASREIFTGPYTLKFTATKSTPGHYDLTVSASSLGPDYHNEDFKLPLLLHDPMIIPPLPVKNNLQILYTLVLLDDTTKIVPSEPDPDDTTKWGISETIHYRTHWLKNSLADFMWNVKIGYLEEIYNQYRASFDLSSSEKIDLYLHPEATNSTYLNPATFYAIQPRVRRIDLVYGHRIDAADPRPGAELQIYRMWGYGPRWMVTGFAGYYFDNDLRVKNYIDKLSAKEVAAFFADESRIDSDTGREVAGAFVHWLTGTQSIVKFTSLYRQSTSLDYARNFNRIYGENFDKALEDFIDHIKKFKPGVAELSYYASIYLAQGYYGQAAKDYKELLKSKDSDNNQFRQSLGMCQFWAGDYNAAEETFNYLSPGGDRPDDNDYMLAIVSMAKDDTSYYSRRNLQQIIKKDYPLAKMDWASILLDRGKIDSARVILENVSDKDRDLSHYYLIVGRLRTMTGLGADSILNMVASNALSSAANAPQDPSFYLTAGRALMLLGKYDQAKENLETSNFLERRPYFIGQTLLELGRLMDLQGKRNEAKSYYKSIIEMNAGAYEKSLAKKYLENKYVIR
jgi:tetratricopeptide (TPR) repeat protein